MTTMTFESIYKKYNKQVLNYLKKRIKDEMTAEELAADVMIKVHKSLHTYKEDLSQFSTWLMNIAKNCMIDHYRKKTLSTVPLDTLQWEWANGEEESNDRTMVFKDDTENPEELLISKEVRRTMYEKFETLNEQEKTVAALHFFDGLSYDEVAQQLRMPLGTVKAKLHNARVRLMEAFPREMRRSC